MAFNKRGNLNGLQISRNTLIPFSNAYQSYHFDKYITYTTANLFPRIYARKTPAPMNKETYKGMCTATILITAPFENYSNVYSQNNS